jgi:ComF family protein
MWILDILAPPSCVFCGTPTRLPERNICTGCFDDLPWNVPPVSSSPGIFECSIAMLHYTFPVDVAIKALKFDRKLYYVPAFAEILVAALPLLPSGIDALVPVPLHWRRKTRRGFNQALELAKPLRKPLDVPVVRGVSRCKATPFQSGLAARERARNLQHAFEASGMHCYQHALIVDDVITTGATAEALAKALLSAGIRKVSVLAVARAG